MEASKRETYEAGGVGDAGALQTSATEPDAEPAQMDRTPEGSQQGDRDPAKHREKISEAAYYRAEERGFAPGNEEADWLAAEQQITGRDT